jgi:hypothetical protein
MSYVPRILQYETEDALHKFLDRHNDQKGYDPCLEDLTNNVLAVDHYYNVRGDGNETGLRRGLSDLIEAIAAKLIYCGKNWKTPTDTDAIFRALRIAYTHGGPYEAVSAFGAKNLLIYGI